jgi:hypothetical protein
MFASTYDGSDGYLVPAYRFTTEDGEGPTVLAIDDSFLAPPPDESGTRDGGTEPGAPGAIEPQPAPASETVPVTRNPDEAPAIGG